MGIQLIFTWVPAHVGVEGNEAVDVLAKPALSSGDVDVLVSMSKAEAKSKIWKVMVEKFIFLGLAMLSTWRPLPGQQPCTPHSNSPKPPHFSFTQIQIADVLKELQNLDPYKSAGLDIDLHNKWTKAQRDLGSTSFYY